MANLTDSIKYLDFTGLQTYDTLIKARIAAGDDAVALQITNLIGTLAQDDAATIEAINDELNGHDAAIATLNGDVETAGSVAKAVKDGIDAVGTGVAQTEAGKAIVSVTQTNGVVVATSGNIKAANVDVEWDTQNPESTTTSVQGALSEIYAKLDENAEAGEIAFYKDVEGVPTKVGTIAADGVTYTLKQGTNTVATMNFALDKVVSSGAVVVATGSETDVPEGQTLVAGQKYVRLVIDNSSDGKNIYIAVNELYDDYTFNNGVEITFTENANVVSAEINTGSIAKEKLTTALQNEITSARTAIVEKATGHVTVTKTAGTGATPDSYTIAENDIASAQGLADEIVRAKAAEGEIAGLVGLGGTEGAKTYTTNVGGANVVADINTLNGRVDSLESFVGNIGTITTEQINGLFA